MSEKVRMPEAGRPFYFQADWIPKWEQVYREECKRFGIELPDEPLGWMYSRGSKDSPPELYIGSDFEPAEGIWQEAHLSARLESPLQIWFEAHSGGLVEKSVVIHYDLFTDGSLVAKES